MHRHAVWVRVSHWIATVAVLTLAVTGYVILMSHPRLYWGDAGNDLTKPLLELPVSRNYHHGGFEGDVRTYNIFNQNGWGRSLHFLAAWLLVVPGVLYVLAGVGSGHFRKRFWREYGLWQGRTYTFVIFVMAPLIVLTGLAMAPAVTAAFPILLSLFGGHQSARTIHFVVFVGLVLFVVGHVLMVARSGFRRQIRAMTLGG
jgi:Ni,Fe-hydrogenase I cytochrome b subunit